MAEQKDILNWEAYAKKAREVVTEGFVLLENNNHVLPFKQGSCISVFGRIQDHYYKSGVGSGGMVNVDHVVDIPEGLTNSGVVTINETLHDIYKAWDREHPYDEGCGWGKEPWSQEEMELTEEIVAQAKEMSDVALVIIGRTAGEDRDMADTEGSYRLTDIEWDMLKKVRVQFEQMVVLLNVGGVIDMAFVDDIHPDAVIYGWQGGMVGGDGVADVLTGKVSPSGKLPDTIAYELADYPAYAYFGDRERNFYCEDIYVGYRYFETFAKECVRYPFGYGLSYTSFLMNVTEASYDDVSMTVHMSVTVTNTGATSGKEVCQVYVEAPQGALGRPARALTAFKKTACLAPGETETIKFVISAKDYAAYDDSGVSGHVSCEVLEAGTYRFYVGSDVRSSKEVFLYSMEETIVTSRLSRCYAPVRPFERMKPKPSGDGYEVCMEPVPVFDVASCVEPAYHADNTTYDGKSAGDGSMTYTLQDVLEKKTSMETFINQLTDYDLSCIVSGEGMGSPLVTAGTAAAFGGVSERLRKYRIPAICCADGPSGIRMDCGTKAFSLPNGWIIGCTFNEELIEELYTFTGMELAANNVECLLGPGMNIHRYPLNGRNFEYYSEDPLVTGALATAMIKGLKQYGVSGVMKHFCGNNQESGRRFSDSVMSERAMREIYLKGYNMAVMSGYADAIMTSYGIVNGTRTAISYDLNTKILRNEWGFDGIVMTDWWAFINDENMVSPKDGYYFMVRAQNDVFMVNAEASKNEITDVSVGMLEHDRNYRKWLRICAANICKYAMKSRAMQRLLGTEVPVIIEGRPEEEAPDDVRNLEYIHVADYFEYDLTYKEAKKGTNYVIPIELERIGTYEVTLTGSATVDELAQIPCSLFIMGTPVGTFTFNGTGGKLVTLKRKCLGFGKKSLYRLNVGGNGLTLTRFTLRFLSENMDLE
ncbi:MAG: glycoside hydrolase family 3 C-terminal domain-containing protein [Lachnospiraceae bacterium]|nr:glycoside hydrolase family 3 C-terminal domain-containing protein [Lachnospiraceae bacterium]